MSIDDENMVRTGRCDCGAISLKITGRMTSVLACHCGQCRRTHGNFATYSNAPRDNVEIAGAENFTWYQSSNFARRGFCKHCGSSLIWERHDSPTLAIATGALEVPTGLRTVGHIFYADRSDYFDVADDLPKMPGTYGTSWPEEKA